MLLRKWLKYLYSHFPPHLPKKETRREVISIGLREAARDKVGVFLMGEGQGWRQQLDCFQ
jgi:hypothetical protein